MSVADTPKMTRKFSGREDYAVCKLEAQWWCAEGVDFSSASRDTWQWKLMIRTPGFVTRRGVDQAVLALNKRGKARTRKSPRRTLGAWRPRS